MPDDSGRRMLVEYLAPLCPKFALVLNLGVCGPMSSVVPYDRTVLRVSHLSSHVGGFPTKRVAIYP